MGRGGEAKICNKPHTHQTLASHFPSLTNLQTDPQSLLAHFPLPFLLLSCPSPFLSPFPATADASPPPPFHQTPFSRSPMPTPLTPARPRAPFPPFARLAKTPRRFAAGVRRWICGPRGHTSAAAGKGRRRRAENGGRRERARLLGGGGFGSGRLVRTDRSGRRNGWVGKAGDEWACVAAARRAVCALFPIFSAIPPSPPLLSLVRRFIFLLLFFSLLLQVDRCACEPFFCSLL